MLKKKLSNRNVIEFVSLEAMVPEDHLLRKIDAVQVCQANCVSFLQRSISNSILDHPHITIITNTGTIVV